MQVRFFVFMFMVRFFSDITYLYFFSEGWICLFICKYTIQQDHKQNSTKH